MLSLKEDSLKFEANANSTGLQKFTLYNHGVTPDKRNVYMYIRTHLAKELEGQVFGYEVFIPKIKKAGTYPLPPKGSGLTITYEEDFEEYPGASSFGKNAWFYNDIKSAEKRFNSLIGSTLNSRKKSDTSTFIIPDNEFSVKELAEQNKIEYPIAFLFVKEQEKAGKVKRTRTERRNERGKETQLFLKI